MSDITLSDLRTSKKVLKYMKKELDKSQGGHITAESELTQNMLDVLIMYADNIAKEMRKNK